MPCVVEGEAMCICGNLASIVLGILLRHALLSGFLCAGEAGLLSEGSLLYRAPSGLPDSAFKFGSRSAPRFFGGGVPYFDLWQAVMPRCAMASYSECGRPSMNVLQSWSTRRPHRFAAPLRRHDRQAAV